jgi:leucyl aminopeptidase
MPPNLWSIAHLPFILPEGAYHIASDVTAEQATQLALGWQLGSYVFARYKKPARAPATLALPKNADAHYVARVENAVTLARDLINTPAADMLPTQLAAAAKKLATTHKARFSVIVGEALLTENYPAIYTVGKASADAPRLIDLRWGNARHPKVTLVGKGVCFDSGGLDIKPSSGMMLMKKDMGGAAAVLALASLVMEYKLPVRLRVLIPAVENAISGNAFRVGDVITTRKGITVEVGNTDAEGRLILADALAEADSEKPDLLIDCATLTGAGRVALGADIPALFSNNDALAHNLQQRAIAMQDPLWHLPLWQGYAPSLKSIIADTNSVSPGGYGGAITAALFLQKFVEHCPDWLHLDMMAWNQSTKPGRPEGGEAMGVRVLFDLLKGRFGG